MVAWNGSSSSERAASSARIWPAAAAPAGRQLVPLTRAELDITDPDACGASPRAPRSRLGGQHGGVSPRRRHREGRAARAARRQRGGRGASGAGLRTRAAGAAPPPQHGLRLRRRPTRAVRGGCAAGAPQRVRPFEAGRRASDPAASPTTSSSAPRGSTASRGPPARAGTSSRRCCGWRARAEPIRVVDDQVLTPTYTADLAKAIAGLIALNPRAGSTTSRTPASARGSSSPRSHLRAVPANAQARADDERRVQRAGQPAPLLGPPRIPAPPRWACRRFARGPTRWPPTSAPRGISPPDATGSPGVRRPSATMWRQCAC